MVATSRRGLGDIGLAELETVLQSALAVFPGCTVPADRAAVDRLLDALTQDGLAVLNRLDRQTRRLDTYPRLVAYMREHEGDLLRPERGLVVVGDTP